MSRDQKFIEASNICHSSNERINKRKEFGGHKEHSKHHKTQSPSDKFNDYGNDRQFSKNMREILLDIKERSIFPRPAPIKTSKSWRGKSQWCEYHKKCRHMTKDI